jgi:hypothetical protein
VASTSPRIERRRASRVLIRIPVKVFSNSYDGEPIRAAAEAVAVSRYGALLRAPLSPAPGTRIEVLNGLNEEVQEFRVIRVVDAKEDGLFELGIEMIFPRSNFWGIHFPGESSPA